MKLKVIRFKDNGTQTLGRGYLYDDAGEKIYEFCTIERPWKDNLHNISCIPVGEYTAEKYNSPSHGLCFLLKDVPYRDSIEIHSANFYHQLKGCIAPGRFHSDIDFDGQMDVVFSKATMNELLSKCHSSLTIEIKNETTV